VPATHDLQVMTTFLREYLRSLVMFLAAGLAAHFVLLPVLDAVVGAVMTLLLAGTPEDPHWQVPTDMLLPEN